MAGFRRDGHNLQFMHICIYISGLPVGQCYIFIGYFIRLLWSHHEQHYIIPSQLNGCHYLRIHTIILSQCIHLYNYIAIILLSI